MTISPGDDSLWLRTRPSLLGRARDTPPGAGRDAAWRKLRAMQVDRCRAA